jgi:hypothetical protein
MELYHVTPTSNIAAILTNGIDPVFSRGKMNVCWFAQSNALLWAIAHISGNKKLDVTRLAVFTLGIDEEITRRTRWKGVLTIATLVNPNRIMHTWSASYWIMQNEPPENVL